MKGANKNFALLTFSLFFIAAAFTGCSDTVGSLVYSVDYIKAVPSRFLYGKNDWFKPAQHVKVIGVYGGVEDTISVDKLNFKIINDPGFTGETEVPIPDNQEGLVLESEGVKTVVITYNNLEARYTIAVGEPGTDEEGGWGEGGTGIEIYWPDE